MRIDATFPARLQAAGPADESRTIRGVAVPWNVEGTVSSGQRVRFEPGSLPASGRPVALLGHDLARPIGRVVDAADNGAALTAAVRVSRTRDGDEALTLAADEVLAMFSVGADPTAHRFDGDTLVVEAAEWVELSLLPIGAFVGAGVSTVTATVPEGNLMTDTAPPVLTLTPEPVDPEPVDPEPVDPDVPELFAATLAPVRAASSHPSMTLQAAGSVPVTGTGRRHRDDLSIRDIARLIQGAQEGRIDRRAAQTRIQAAIRAAEIQAQSELTDVTLVGTANVGAANRPTYMVELLEIVSAGRPAVESIARGDLVRGDYPNKSFARWTATPTVGLQAAEKDAITSTAVSTAIDGTPVLTWAGGNDISVQTIDLGPPNFVEDYIRAAGIDYARKSDTYAVAQLLAGATAVTTLVGATFVDVLGALVAALDPALTPPGPLSMLVSYDVGVSLIGVTRDQAPAFWDGNVNFGTYAPTVNAGGLTVTVDPNLAGPGQYLLGARNGAKYWEPAGVPFNLRLNDVAHLGLDVVVYGYGACDVQYAGSWAKTTVPAGP